MKKLDKNKKILLILLSILLLVVIPISCYTLFAPKFKVKEFESVIEIPLQSEFEGMSGNICYGNVFSCEAVKPEIKGEVNTSTIGEYDVTYTYQTGHEKLVKEQTVKVIDEEAPTIEVTEGEYFYCPSGEVKNSYATAKDNYDGDLTDKMEVVGKDGKIYFSVTDSSGNQTTKEVEAIEKDDGPVIKLNGDSTIYVPLNGTYTEKGATSTDTCDGDLTSKIEMSGTVDTKKAGVYKIEYKVTDSKGTQSIATRTVYVYANNDPNAPNGKSIYLTFDDGPSAYTSKLLDILKKYNVKATFFVTNQGLTQGYDDVILRAYQEGHTIGLHTNSHQYSIYTNEQTYFDDLYAIQSKVERITGQKSMIIRFPGGSSNTVSKNYDNGAHIMSTLTKAVEAKGFRYFDWNIESKDAGGAYTASAVYSNIVKALGNNSTYMVLQHDIKSFSVDAVSSVIEYGLSHGYTFRPITMDTPNVHHRINN